MEHVDALLPEYLAGDLDPQARARVEVHLQACVRCREEGGWAHPEAEKRHLDLSEAHPGLLGQARLHSRHGRG